MLSNKNSPVSAFTVYRKQSQNKSKTKSLPTVSSRKNKKTESDPIKVPKNLVSIHKKKTKLQQNGVKSGQKINPTLLANIQKQGDKNGKKNKNKKNHKGATKQQLHNNSPNKNIKSKEPLANQQVDFKVNDDDDDSVPPILVPIYTPDNSFNSDNDKSIQEGLLELNKTDPSTEGLKLFKWLIAPINPATFFEKYWEAETLHIEHGSENYYSDILTTQRLDNIFREYPLYYTKNVDVVSYENGVKEVHNEEGRVVASALYDYYSNGCSIRVLNPHTYDQKVHLLIATLQEYFGTMVGANIYLTPPDSQGFAPHYDDIEAFVIQLEGRKHWKLYKPRGSDVLARDSSPNLKHEDIGEPFMEVTLNAGDLLYFPRGTIHEGRTDADAHSFHITISVYQHNSYADLLEHALPVALKKAALEDIEFRKGLPLHYLKHTGYINGKSKSKQRKEITQTVNKLLDSLKDHINVDRAADQLGRKFMYDSMPPVLSKQEVNFTSKYDGDYMKDGKICNRVEIDMDTEVRLLRYYCLRLVVEEDSAKIYYNTENAKYYHGEEEQFLTIDRNLIPCIEKLQRNYPNFVKVEDLPIEEGDDISKAQLVSDLWERGLLVTDGPLSQVSDGENESSEEEEDIYEEVFD